MKRGDLNDTRLFWKLAARPEGVHSHEARRLGVSGNPSQRAKDCADRVPMWKVRAPRNGRNGTRYFADGRQPSDATRVKPNRSEKDSPELGVIHKPVVLAWYRDYRDPEGEWKQVPLEELGFAA